MEFKKIVFLDRDGVINIDKEYVYKIEDFEFIYEAPYGIRKLNMAGINPFVVTNQSGIERGFYTEEQFLNLTDHIDYLLTYFNATIESTYYSKYIDAPCKKPNTGMIDSILQDYKLTNIKKFMYMVGDKLTDIQAGNRSGCFTILISTDKFISRKIKKLDEVPDVIVPNLNIAADYILKTPSLKSKCLNNLVSFI